MNHRTYYINLDTRPDRRKNAEQQFARMGLKDVVRFPAIQRSEKTFQPWMGCRDSHIEIIRQAQRDQLDFVTVFEDDLDFLVTDKTYYAQLFADAGLVSPFGGERDKPLYVPQVHLLYLSANTHQPLLRAGGTRHLYHALLVRSTAAIVYTRHIYDQILRDQKKKLIRKIDLYYEQFIQPRGHCYVASRLCCTQMQGFSDIEKQQVDYSFIQERFRKHVAA